MNKRFTNVTKIIFSEFICIRHKVCARITSKLNMFETNSTISRFEKWKRAEIKFKIPDIRRTSPTIIFR